MNQNKIKAFDDYLIKWGLSGFRFYNCGHCLMAIRQEDEPLHNWSNQIKNLPTLMKWARLQKAKVCFFDSISPRQYQTFDTWDEFLEYVLCRKISGI